MLTLEGNDLVFSFPEVHPEARLRITLMRTFRIPDDGKKYPLPPGFSKFPVKMVDDVKNSVPESWIKHGGVIVPMYQSEAMWLGFNSASISDRAAQYPFAIRIATGKRNALTGGIWTDSLREDEYVISPTQPWLDGYVVADGMIRQFVAAPLGQGFTAEEQITGKAEFGGLQIEVIPRKRESFDKRYPKVERLTKGGIMKRLGGPGGQSAGNFGLESAIHAQSRNYSCNMSEVHESSSSFDMDLCRSVEEEGDVIAVACAATAVSELGMAPGGTMEQQVYKDPFGLTEWHATEKSRCFVHFLNSMTWRTVTKTDPPMVPITAADYSRHGLPWFDHYRDDLKVASGTSITSGLKGVAQLDKEKGTSILPENESASPKKIIHTASTPKGAVRDGNW